MVAALLSAGAAAGAVGLAGLGWISAPHSEAFQFSRGVSFASGEESRLRGFLSEALKDDRLRVAIVGHSGVSGDAAANLALSQQRADQVVAIATEMGVSADQITATGVGGAAPLAQQSGEAERAYQARLARVEVTLQLRK